MNQIIFQELMENILATVRNDAQSGIYITKYILPSDELSNDDFIDILLQKFEDYKMAYIDKGVLVLEHPVD